MTTENKILTDIGYDEASCELLIAMLRSCDCKLVSLDNTSYVKDNRSGVLYEINEKIINNDYTPGRGRKDGQVYLPHSLGNNLQILLNIEDNLIAYQNGVVHNKGGNYNHELLSAYLYHKTKILENKLNNMWELLVGNK
jgi:hypothetical protein